MPVLTKKYAKFYANYFQRKIRLKHADLPAVGGSRPPVAIFLRHLDDVTNIKRQILRLGALVRVLGDCALERELEFFL